MADPAVAREAFHTPMGEILRSVALGVADAQFELDRSSMAVAELLGGRRRLRDAKGEPLRDASGAPAGVDTRVYFGYTRQDGQVRPIRSSMLELGFTPRFYQFVDNVVELKLALRLSRGADQRLVASATPVDGAYTSSYGFDLAAASVLRAKLVPVPPPPSLGGWVQAKIEDTETAAGEAA